MWPYCRHLQLQTIGPLDQIGNYFIQFVIVKRTDYYLQFQNQIRGGTVVKTLPLSLSNHMCPLNKVDNLNLEWLKEFKQIVQSHHNICLFDATKLGSDHLTPTYLI